MSLHADSLMAAMRARASQGAQRSIVKAKVLSTDSEGNMILELEMLSDMSSNSEQETPMVRLASEFSPGSA